MENRWLSGGRSGGNEGVVTRNLFDGDYEENTASSTYQWTIRSELGNGNIDDQDPRSGECVAYGDVIHGQVNYVDSRWLSGGRSEGNEGVITRNFFDGGYEENTAGSTYQWTLRSESGNGNIDDQDPRNGECIAYNDIIFIQVNFIDNKWLTGARGGDSEGVLTRNCRDGGYEESILSTYQWIVRDTLFPPSSITSVPTSPPSPAPTSAPTLAPTPAPTLLPTSSPTSAPTSAPSTTCMNSGFSIAYTTTAGGSSISCEFVSEFANCLCDNEDVSSHCPSTCDGCAEYGCVDSIATWYTPSGSVGSCVTFSSFDPGTIARYCASSEDLRMTCRSTCGVCD